LFTIFATLAEFERDLIAERTKAGLAAARARGRAGGPPPKMDVALLRFAMNAMKDRDTSPAQLAKQINISTNTFYAYVNADGSPKARGHALLAKDTASAPP
jgi:DNA invertase Pin-like site-specific DNA recombinase